MAQDANMDMGVVVVRVQRLGVNKSKAEGSIWQEQIMESLAQMPLPDLQGCREVVARVALQLGREPSG